MKNVTVIYSDTEKELFPSDYRPLPVSLIKYSIPELEKLLDNLEAAEANAYAYHNDLLALALDSDIRRTELYITMAYKRQKRQEGKKQ